MHRRATWWQVVTVAREHLKTLKELPMRSPVYSFLEEPHIIVQETLRGSPHLATSKKERTRMWRWTPLHWREARRWKRDSGAPFRKLPLTTPRCTDGIFIPLIFIIFIWQKHQSFTSSIIVTAPFFTPQRFLIRLFFILSLRHTIHTAPRYPFYISNPTFMLLVPYPTFITVHHAPMNSQTSPFWHVLATHKIVRNFKWNSGNK